MPAQYKSFKFIILNRPHQTLSKVPKARVLPMCTFVYTYMDIICTYARMYRRVHNRCMYEGYPVPVLASYVCRGIVCMPPLSA